MSKRNKGSRLEGREVECFFCMKSGKHKVTTIKGIARPVCNECFSLAKVTE